MSFYKYYFYYSSIAVLDQFQKNISVQFIIDCPESLNSVLTNFKNCLLNHLLKNPNYSELFVHSLYEESNLFCS